MNNPIFQSIFEKQWEQLPPVMRKHYANRPYSEDVVRVEGRLDVSCKWWARWVFMLTRSVPPHIGSDVPVTVSFQSNPKTAEFCLNRTFHFSNQKPYPFISYMSQVQGNEVVERMRFGVCWHCHFEWDGKRVQLIHKGYSWRIFTKRIPLPLTALIGRGDAWEEAVSETEFDMCVTMKHWLLGEFYSYKGRFEMV